MWKNRTWKLGLINNVFFAIRGFISEFGLYFQCRVLSAQPSPYQAQEYFVGPLLVSLRKLQENEILFFYHNCVELRALSMQTFITLQQYGLFRPLNSLSLDSKILDNDILLFYKLC